jgi:DNA modification methylase
MSYQIIQGDCIEGMKQIPDASVHCVVTSPPYYGLRDYGVDGQIGLEESPEAYVARLVDVFREVRRILRDDGTVWLNLGDTYVSNAGDRNKVGGFQANPNKDRLSAESAMSFNKHGKGYKFKDLMGIPWRVAFALQADGWYLRQDIIWHKPNPMPESVTDRCTKSHEYIFLLSKSARYYFDHEAIKEVGVMTSQSSAGSNQRDTSITHGVGGGNSGINEAKKKLAQELKLLGHSTRNKRSVWTVATQPYPEAHFAVYPTKLIEPCILAGTSEKGCCATCGAPWKRLNGRSCKNCGNFIEHQHKSCNTCGFINNGWKNERVVNLATRAGESDVIGSLVARKSQITVNHISLDFIKSCNCDSDVVPCTVFDPFTGSGTTGLVALTNNRNFIGTELNPEYVKIAEKRLSTVQPKLI